MANRWLEGGRVLLKDDVTNKNLDWSERMNIAIEKINKINPPILYDFGCGECKVREKINKEIKYQGFDSIGHAEGVLIIDLNEEFPDIIPYSGLGLFLGIFEYIDNFQKILNFILNNFDQFIFSCRDRDFDTFEDKIKLHYDIFLINKSINFPPKQSVYIAKLKNERI